MNDQTLITTSGTIRECAVIPRMNDEGVRRDYVLLTIASNGVLKRFVSGATYFAKLAENYGVIIPTPNGKSLPVSQLIGKVVEIQYEQSIAGRTRYLDDNGKEQIHKTSGNNLRRMFVLDDSSAEANAYRNSHLEQQGVSHFAISTAAQQQATIMQQALAAIKQVSNIPEQVPPQTPPAQHDEEGEPIPAEEDDTPGTKKSNKK